MNKAVESGMKALYHYQGFNAEHLKDILEKRRLYVSSPQDFNDPWDCRPYLDTSVEAVSIRDKWQRLLEPLLPSHFREVLGDRWCDDRPLLIRTIEQVTSLIAKNNGERWRVYCLTPHPDSLLMWAHYADKHRGICLEFDADPCIGQARQVCYARSMPSITVDMLLELGTDDSVAKINLLTKSVQWAYEDEYRILHREPYLTLGPGTLKSVILGCNADNDRIGALVREMAPDVTVKRALRSNGQYGIDIVD